MMAKRQNSIGLLSLEPSAKADYPKDLTSQSSDGGSLRPYRW